MAADRHNMSIIKSSLQQSYTTERVTICKVHVLYSDKVSYSWGS